MANTKVVIIDVDLGINIDEIIADNAKELTDASKKELDGALAIAEAAKQMKEAKTVQRNQASTGISSVMEQAYEQLEKAGSTGCSVDSILELVSPHVPNSSAFSLRMNNILSSKGNPYRLIRIKIAGNPHYLFTEFNEKLNN